MSRAFPERTLEIEGQTYRLVLDINAQALLEDKLSTPKDEVVFQTVAQKAIEGSVRHARWLFWASLQRYHSDITPERAGDLMSAASDAPGALSGALSETRPDEADVKALGVKKSRPRKAPTA